MKSRLSKILTLVGLTSDSSVQPINKGYSGVYVHPVSEIIEQHVTLIEKTRALSDVSDDRFEDIYMSVIRNLAGYAHALPASEADHHSDLLGFFRHALEVGLYTLQATHASVYRGKSESDLERVRGPIWRYAAWLTGLLHDLGKLVSDMQVHSLDGIHIWHPLNASLISWADHNKIERYTVVWPDRTLGAHERTSSSLLVNVMSRAGIDYIYSGHNGQNIYDEILKGLLGTKNGRFVDIVKKADGISCSRDLDRQTRNVLSESTKTSLSQHLIRVFKQMYKDPQYKGLFYPMSDSLGLAYPTVIVIAQNILTQERIAVPSKYDDIAIHLLRNRFIYFDDTTRSYVLSLVDRSRKEPLDALYWRIPDHIIGYGAVPTDDNYYWKMDSNKEDDTTDDVDTSTDQQPEKPVTENTADSTTEVTNINEAAELLEESNIDESGLDANTQTLKKSHNTSTSSHHTTTSGQESNPVTAAIQSFNKKASDLQKTNVNHVTEDQTAKTQQPESRQKNNTDHENSSKPISFDSPAITFDIGKINGTKDTPRSGRSKNDIVMPGLSSKKNTDKAFSGELQKTGPSDKPPKPGKNPRMQELIKLGPYGPILAALSNDLFNERRHNMITHFDNGLGLRFPDAIEGYGTKPETVLTQLQEAGCLTSQRLAKHNEYSYIILKDHFKKLMLPSALHNTTGQRPNKKKKRRRKTKNTEPDAMLADREEFNINDTHFIECDKVEHHTLDDLLLSLIHEAVREKKDGFIITDNIVTTHLNNCINYMVKRISTNSKWHSKFIKTSCEVQRMVKITKSLTSISHSQSSVQGDMKLSIRLDSQ
jgi:hypothetical protein